MPPSRTGTGELMSPELEKKLQEQYQAVAGLYRAGQIDENTYYKCLVCLAFEYGQDDQVHRAAAIIQGIPLAYFRDSQPKQMQEDHQYAVCAYTLALRLVRGGIVHVGAKVTPNMGSASA